MEKIKILMSVLVLLLVFSCGSKKKTTTVQKPKNESVIEHPKAEEIVVKEVEGEQPVSPSGNPIKKPKSNRKPLSSNQLAKVNYIEKYKDVAMEEMRKYNIPASITLAQGILESGSGKSELSSKSNNHFGIKCHKGWKGGRVYHDDDAKGECFRKYKHPSYSYRDHSLFLSERKRYMGLFKLSKSDYKGWAKGLKAAGYATDKKYPQKLISIIEQYELYQYDKLILGENYQPIKKKRASANDHIVQKGDTLYSISRKFKVSVEDLKEINGLEGNTISVGQKLYLKKL